jgi:hypothetical protein
MSDEVKDIKKSSATEELAQLELQIKREELEQLKLSRQEREYSIKDLKGRLAERDVKELQKKEDREAQGRTFAQQRGTDEARWKVCTHKKGGNVSQRDMRVLSTGGNATQYAVMKHQMINGDIWVRCLRCGKTWSPPLKSKFYFDVKGKQVPTHMGEFDRIRFENAVIDYNRAVAFETNNTMSGSVQVRFSRWDEKSQQLVDASKDYAESIADTTLR